MKATRSKNIWIDLDNSPHVPFFLPIIEELDRRGYHIFLTARDSYQVCELIDFHGLSERAKVIGHHWGKNRSLKILGTLLRVLQLLPDAIKERPCLAVSHGSRAQVLASFVLRIPSISIMDYEHATGPGGIMPDWIFLPDLIPMSNKIRARQQILRYPGLKEDVYAPAFRPDPSIKAKLGVGETNLVVTIRPPATEAHYHNKESELLLDGVLSLLTKRPDISVVLVPRNEKQSQALRTKWSKAIGGGKIIVPEHVVDGLNLIWFSDLVVSGGGTMNREAAALAVPVYSIFRGKIGAVDKYLADQGRLTLIASLEDVHSKIILKRRTPIGWNQSKQGTALDCVVKAIVSIVEHGHLPTHH
jgi:uncharacterized protein